jgi:hypothetical protein
MPPLLELQGLFAAAVARGELSAVSAFVTDDAPGAAARLAIHANHFRVTLIEALANTFPVVRRLVGGDFFAAAARAFIQEFPPTGPCLFEYGGAFPRFLDRLPGVRPMPWLRDVAALEWAIAEAWHAGDAEPASEEALQRLITGEASRAVALHPSCRLLRSPFPVDRIWQAHQTLDEELETVDLGAGGARLLVHRYATDVGWFSLDADAAVDFIAGLLDGEGLGDALNRVTRRHDGWDPTRLLAALLTADLLVSREKFQE